MELLLSAAPSNYHPDVWILKFMVPYRLYAWLPITTKVENNNQSGQCEGCFSASDGTDVARECLVAGTDRGSEGARSLCRGQL